MIDFQAGNNAPRQSRMGSPTNPNSLIFRNFSQHATLFTQAAQIRGAIEFLEAEHRAIVSTISQRQCQALRINVSTMQQTASVQGPSYSLPLPRTASSCLQLQGLTSPEAQTLAICESPRRGSGPSTQRSSRLDLSNFMPQQMRPQDSMRPENHQNKSHPDWPFPANAGLSISHDQTRSNFATQHTNIATQPAPSAHPRPCPDFTAASQPAAGAAFFASLSFQRGRPDANAGNAGNAAAAAEGAPRGRPTRVTGKAVLDAKVSPIPLPRFSPPTPPHPTPPHPTTPHWAHLGPRPAFQLPSRFHITIRSLVRIRAVQLSQNPPGTRRES
jgi:hypothetical protein